MEADEATTVEQCGRLSTYLFNNRTKYPKTEVTFGIEHIKDKAEYLKQQSDIAKMFEQTRGDD